jgi:Domain of unknown function (DUF3943)
MLISLLLQLTAAPQPLIPAHPLPAQSVLRLPTNAGFRPSVSPMLGWSARPSPECPDCEPRPKHFWRGSGEVISTLLIPWAFNKWVRDVDFADITWESMWTNITGPWVWDDNDFQTNQIAHPIHGSLYFNSFRTNGYNFWASSAATAAGSWLWENLMETYPPSPNDMITTTLGGIALGEMLFRLSNLTLDNTATGSERVFREIGGFLLSPWNGMNRILDGRTGRVVANPEGWRPSAIQGALDVGTRFVGSSGTSYDVLGDPLQDLSVAFRLVYGRPMEDLVGRPFSTFTLASELAFGQDRQKLQLLTVEGNLGGNVLKDTDKVKHIFAVTMNYDYNFVPNTDSIENAVLYNYGAQSFTAGLHSDFRLSPHWQLLTNVAARGVALGAVRSDYYNVVDSSHVEESRNYDFGPGLGLLAGATFVNPGRALVKLRYGTTWIHTVDGTDYDHYLTNASFEARYFPTGRIGVGASYEFLRRTSVPVDLATAPGPETTLNVPILRLFVSTAIPHW